MQPDATNTPGIDPTPNTVSTPPPASAAPQQPVVPPPATPQTGNWQFTGGNPAPAADIPAAMPTGNSQSTVPDHIEWTASEYVAHDKPSSWYAALGIVVVAVIGLVYLLTRDIVSIVVVLVVALLFGYSAARKPQVRQFGIDNRGVTMGARFHSFHDLKSFTVSGDGAIRSIVLMPLKRYMPPVSMYFPPEQEGQIVSALSQYLPFEPERNDAVERVMRRIKF